MPAEANAWVNWSWFVPKYLIGFAFEVESGQLRGLGGHLEDEHCTGLCDGDGNRRGELSKPTWVPEPAMWAGTGCGLGAATGCGQAGGRCVVLTATTRPDGCRAGRRDGDRERTKRAVRHPADGPVRAKGDLAHVVGVAFWSGSEQHVVADILLPAHERVREHEKGGRT